MTTQTVGIQEKTIVVGLGEMKVSNDTSAILTCLGLGSCVGVCAYDPISKVGGMAHVVLPSSEGRSAKLSAKYADMAVPMLFEAMKELGSHKSRLIVKLIGGAELSAAPGLDNSFQIGDKNQEVIKIKLAEEGVKWAAEDLGDSYGRTVRLYLDSGKVLVSAAGRETKEL